MNQDINNKKKLYIIDGMSLVFRAYHAMSRSGLTSATGEATSAVFAFVNILTSLLEKEKPEYAVVAFDTKHKTFRHELYDLYKANRDAFPEDLVPQLIRIKEFLNYLAFPTIEAPGYEADDIIGTLAHHAELQDFKTLCLTSDKDLYQLVTENTLLYKPSKNPGQDFEIIDIEAVNKKFGVLPSQVADVLALIGDSSDNIPGVPGIGEKSAPPLIRQFGSVENLYENIDQVTPIKIREKLESGRERAFLAKKLTVIDISIPLDKEISDLKITQPDYKKLDKFFSELGFIQIRKKWALKNPDLNLSLDNKSNTLKPETESNEETKILDSNNLEVKNTTEADKDIFKQEQIENSSTKKIRKLEDVEHEYIFIDSIQKFDSMINNFNNTNILSVDLETSSLDRASCEIVGISLCSEPRKAYYIPVYEDSIKSELIFQNDLFETSLSDKKTEDKNIFRGLDFKLIKNQIKELLENEYISKIGQNIKFDTFILKRYGIDLKPIIFDSIVASYILNPDELHGMDSQALRRLNYEPIPITSLIGEKKSNQISMRDISPEKISDYACEDADITLQLRNFLYEELKKQNLLDLAEKLDFPLIEVLTLMEFNGISIDYKALSDISKRIIEETNNLKNKIYEEANGVIFNIDSPKQLGEVLFEKLNIPTLKSTKTGFSTDVQVLEELSQSYPIARFVLEYRSLMKLKSTYTDALPKLVNHITQRIHTTYHQASVSTGRLSSTDPNLQNIPIRSQLGKEVRRAFIPKDPTWKILSADYSQIELRIMAYYSKDIHLIEAFKNNEDIHSATASILFDKSIENIDSDMRRVAKTVNFGIMYGLGGFGLSQRLGMSRTEAQSIIKNYFEKYPGIKNYIDSTIEKTKKLGFAETLLGRRRYFQNINSKNHNLRAADERAAINMPIQGTASDMMKIAMINIHRQIQENKLLSLMLLQVHDELVFETPESEIEILKSIVINKMENALELGVVPVKVDIGFGANWFEAH